MAGHTPGPWVLDPSDLSHVLDDQYHGIGIGNTRLVGFITEADARLIVAAPDLLEALKALMNDIDSGVLVRDITHDGEPGWSIRMMDFVGRLKAAQAAIANTTHV